MPTGKGWLFMAAVLDPFSPAVADPSTVTSARICHCRYESLAALAELRNVTTLVIATYPDSTFETLSALTSLQYLSVLHFPHVSDLAPRLSAGG